MKKILLALVMVAFLATAVQAHEDWPNTTSVVWLKKPGPTIPVKIKVVRWAQITFCDNNVTSITLQQVEGDTFEGCICLKLCVNFAGLNIKAKYNQTKDVRVPNAGGKNYVSLVKAGDPRNYKENETTLNWTTIQLTGNLGTLELCVKITKVDPQALSYDAGTVQEIGNVTMEMWPSGNP